MNEDELQELQFRQSEITKLSLKFIIFKVRCFLTLAIMVTPVLSTPSNLLLPASESFRWDCNSMGF